MKITARSLAVRLLMRIEEEGAYANLLLQKNLDQLEDGRDRQLTTLLVNGVAKHRLTLDYILRQQLRKPLSALPGEIKAILRVGAFQLLFLDKIPPAAAVYEAVEQAKGKHANFSALVNGVLRQILRQGWDIAWPDRGREGVRYLAVRYSHPEWMVKRWLNRLGPEETEALCRINNEPPQTWIRTNTLKIGRAELMERLEARQIKVEIGERVRESLRIADFGAIDQLDEFRQGFFTIQDESSQLVGHVLDPRRGQTVLDGCSAPGGKTTHLAQLMENAGAIRAFDIHSHKLELVECQAERLGIDIIQSCLGDARELPGIDDRSMDRVLIDVPCSGLGVLRRKADMRWQKEEADLAALPVLQREILERAARAVKPGGELVYSTCTIEPEENFEVVKVFRQAHPEFKPVDILPVVAPFITGDIERNQAQKGMLQLYPQRHGTDGFFLAKFSRLEV